MASKTRKSFATECDASSSKFFHIGTLLSGKVSVGKLVQCLLLSMLGVPLIWMLLEDDMVVNDTGEGDLLQVPVLHYSCWFVCCLVSDESLCVRWVLLTYRIHANAGDVRVEVLRVGVFVRCRFAVASSYTFLFVLFSNILCLCWATRVVDFLPTFVIVLL